MTEPLYDYAIRLLARRAYGTEELRRRLRRRPDASETENVIARLTSHGYLDDAAFAGGRARFCRLRKHWGNLRIRQDLKRLGLSARMIRLAIGSLDDVCSERESLRAVIESWIKSKGRPAKAAELKKLYDRCFRLGYGAQLVREELGEFFDRIDW